MRDIDIGDSRIDCGGYSFSTSVYYQFYSDLDYLIEPKGVHKNLPRG